MHSILEVKARREELLDSLLSWRSEEDSFYRSSPVSTAKSPSFTNTSMALQAFNEGERRVAAQDLATRLLNWLKEHPESEGLFPHEKAPRSPHVVCNAWAAFSILDVFPGEVGSLEGVKRWLLKIQDHEGGWPLMVGDKTRAPMVTAYAISALQQFYSCSHEDAKWFKRSRKRELQDLEMAIQRGVDYLLRVISVKMRQKNLCLWPTDLDGGALSLGTSAICMHVIAKWNRIRSDSAGEDALQNTLHHLVDGFDSLGAARVVIGGEQLDLWDQLFLNDGELNYQWYFFPPICLVTIISLARELGLLRGNRLEAVIATFARWISDSTRSVMRGEESFGVGVVCSLLQPRVQVWSTALSVVVLSRILAYYRDLGRQPEWDISGSDFPQERLDKGIPRTAPRVVISYAREDEEAARKLYRDLKKRGARPWMDLEDLVGGSLWEREIKEAIRNSEYVLALISHSSVNKRGFVHAEIELALKTMAELPAGKVFIIPCRLEDVIPAQEELRKRQRIDLFLDYEAGLTDILRAINMC